MFESPSKSVNGRLKSNITQNAPASPSGHAKYRVLGLNRVSAISRPLLTRPYGRGPLRSLPVPAISRREGNPRTSGSGQLATSAAVGHVTVFPRPMTPAARGRHHAAKPKTSGSRWDPQREASRRLAQAGIKSSGPLPHVRKGDSALGVDRSRLPPYRFFDIAWAQAAIRPHSRVVRSWTVAAKTSMLRA